MISLNETKSLPLKKGLLSAGSFPFASHFQGFLLLVAGRVVGK